MGITSPGLFPPLFGVLLRHHRRAQGRGDLSNPLARSRRPVSRRLWQMVVLLAFLFLKVAGQALVFVDGGWLDLV